MSEVQKAAAAIIRGPKGILLMHDIKLNKVTVPSCELNPEETMEEALARVLLEYTGLTVVSAIFKFKVTNNFENKGNVEQHIFEVKVSGVMRNKEPQKYKWLEYRDIEESKWLTNPSNILKQIKERSLI